jgi:predicted peptidase
MKALFYKLYPRLTPFNYATHYQLQLNGMTWVLLNSIKDKRIAYCFKDDNALEIIEDDKTIHTSWKHITTNFISIKNEDGEQLISLYYKGDDILIINKKGTEEYSFFINETNAENTLNTEKDIKDYFKNKYAKKASSIIEKHQFYYIQNSTEHGPFTAKQLSIRVKGNIADKRCFVREVNESNYNRRLRIKDLLNEMQ